jgi:hypothetical protein
MQDQLACTKCDYRATGKETKCPQCGGWIRRAQRIRRLGFVLVPLGFFLVAMMGTLSISLAPMMFSAGQQTTGSRFTGTPEQALLILGLFGIIIVFGFACMAGGLFQIVTGRRSIWIIVLVLVLTFLMIVAASAVRTALDRAAISNPPEIYET